MLSRGVSLTRSARCSAISRMEKLPAESERTHSWRVDNARSVAFYHKPDAALNVAHNRVQGQPHAPPGSVWAPREVLEGWILASNGYWLPTQDMRQVPDDQSVNQSVDQSVDQSVEVEQSVGAAATDSRSVGGVETAGGALARTRSKASPGNMVALLGSGSPPGLRLVPAADDGDEGEEKQPVLARQQRQQQQKGPVGAGLAAASRGTGRCWRCCYKAPQIERELSDV